MAVISIAPSRFMEVCRYETKMTERMRPLARSLRQIHKTFFRKRNSPTKPVPRSRSEDGSGTGCVSSHESGSVCGPVYGSGCGCVYGCGCGFPCLSNRLSVSLNGSGRTCGLPSMASNRSSFSIENYGGSRETLREGHLHSACS